VSGSSSMLSTFLFRPRTSRGGRSAPRARPHKPKAVLKVVFRSLPRPAEVPAWTHYRFQILSTADSGPVVAWESNSYPKPAGKQKNVAGCES